MIDTLYATIKDITEEDVAIKKIPQFFWILHRKIPEIFNKHSKTYQDLFGSIEDKEEDEQVKQRRAERLKKWDEIKKRSVVFVMVNTLRNEGCYISRDVSWERAAQDYMRAYYSNPLMSGIKEFSHVILRFGVNGAIYSAALEETRCEDTEAEETPSRRCVHRLYFDPEAKRSGLYRDPEQDGDLIGYQSLFASCTLLEIIKYQRKYSNDIDFLQLIQVIGRGIRKSIKCCQTIFDHGFGRDKEEIEKYFENIEESIEALLKEDKNSYLEIGNERIPVESPGWSLLKQSAEYHLFESAVEVVKQGISSVVNNKNNVNNKKGNTNLPIWAPVVKFKRLEVVDRREIESYKAVHSLLVNVMTHKQDKPLSIAVFGPPGSGKSFTVNELIASANPGIEIYFRIINMTQITSYDELKKEFDKAHENHELRRLPVLFFDEFDSAFEGKAHGWLKYFLMPMEDWENPKEAKDDRPRKGSPIFIFAGGTSHSYTDFSREDVALSEDQRAKFVQAKGPDFVSRLRGHINILGPNRVDDDDDAHVIRRAILLGSIMEQNKIKSHEIDDSIIRAMLRVSSFKHGARSMRAVISMCAKLGGKNGKIVSSVLPTLPQLNMHVNGKEFIEMIISESESRQISSTRQSSGSP